MQIDKIAIGSEYVACSVNATSKLEKNRLEHIEISGNRSYYKHNYRNRVKVVNKIYDTSAVKGTRAKHSVIVLWLDWWDGTTKNNGETITLSNREIKYLFHPKHGVEVAKRNDFKRELQIVRDENEKIANQCRLLLETLGITVNNAGTGSKYQGFINVYGGNRCVSDHKNTELADAPDALHKLIELLHKVISSGQFEIVNPDAYLRLMRGDLNEQNN